MEASVIWKQRMTFTGQADSGFPITLGTDAAAGGDNDGVRPMELVAIAMAGCTAMDVLSILNKKREIVTAFEVQVHADRVKEPPKVFSHAVIEYFVTGHQVSEAAVLRAIELSATRYCPVFAMLSQVFPTELKYKIFEDGAEDERELIARGEYTPFVEQAD